MRTDLGLTYNLVFPDSGRTVVGQEKSGLYENLNNPNDGTGVGESPIVVILLGWLEAKDSQLEKYSNIYLKRGCIVLRCITPTRVLYYDIAKLPAIAGQVIDILKDNQLQAHPKFFHAFSNGGAYLYSYILREIAAQSNPADFNIRGTIFDSGPLSPTAKVIYTVLQTTCSSYKIFGTSLAPAIACGYLLLIFLMILRAVMRFAWERFFYGCFKRLSGNYREEPFPLCNFLTRIWKSKNHSFVFLYSEEDAITPFEEVESIAGVIRNRGNSVKLVKFDGSAHVQHYKMYPNEYVSAVTDFVRSTMKSYNGPPILFDA